MRLVSYEVASGERFGALASEGDGIIVDLPTALAFREERAGRSSDPGVIADCFGADLLGFLARQADAAKAVRDLFALHRSAELPATFRGEPLLRGTGTVRLLAPLPRPPSVRDGYAFRQHVETARKNRGLEMIPEFDDFPVFYFTNHQAIVGPGDVRVEPLHLDKLDFELESAIVIGRAGRNIPASEADDYIFGLTIMNDWSARGLQMHEMKLNLGPAKGKDFATSLGPTLVSMDELADVRLPGPAGARFDLAMTASVNGIRVSAGNLKDMHWTFAQIIERASYGATLHPGDVIGSGTVGTGCFLELNGAPGASARWLHPGDVVVLEIDRLGRLENRVVLAGAHPSDRND